MWEKARTPSLASQSSTGLREPDEEPVMSRYMVELFSTAGLLTTAFAAVGPGMTQFVLILVGGATMTAAVGPVSAVLVDVVHPGLRATAISALTVVQNLVGLAIGPVLAGWLSDRYGLTAALSALPLLCVVSSAMFWYGSRFYERDRAAVLRPASRLPQLTLPE